MTTQTTGELATYKSHADYDADPRVRSTQLKAIMEPQGPRAYYLKYVNPPADVDAEFDSNDLIQPKVSEMVLGTLLHEYSLQGKCNWFITQERRGSNAWKDDIEEHPGLWALTPKNNAKVLAWHDAMMRNREVRELIESGSFSEQAFRFTHSTGIKAKARIDLFSFEGHIWDLKTTAATDRDGFERQMVNLNYPFSASFYLQAVDAVPELHGMNVTFKHIVLCKSHPYYCYIWELDRSWLRLGHADVDTAFSRLHTCLERERNGDPWDVAWPDVLELKQGETIAPSEWLLAKKGYTEEEW